MKWWAAVCGLAVILVIALADTQRLGFLYVVYKFPHGDKVGHFVVFGLLSLLVNLAVLESRPKTAKRPLLLWTNVVLAVVIGAEELSQIWVPWRTSSIWDLLASYVGVAFFAWVAVVINRRKNAAAAARMR